MKDSKTIEKLAKLLIPIIKKGATLLGSLKALQAIRALGPVVMVVTVFLSILSYGWSFGWQFIIGTVAMFLIHECGHAVVLYSKGYPIRVPVFIPMVGAIVFGPQKMDRETESYIGMGGPALGTIGALLCWGVWAIHPDHPTIWLITSYIGISLNLFNMIPIHPLDGGRITQSIGNWFRWVGLVVLIGLTLLLQDPGLLLIWTVAVVDSERIPLKIKSILLLIIQAMMLAAIIFGLGETNRWIYILDFVLVQIFSGKIVVPFVMQDKEFLARMEQDSKTYLEKKRPALSKTKRLKWFVYYMMYTILLSIVIHEQTKQIKPWVDAQKQQRHGRYLLEKH